MQQKIPKGGVPHNTPPPQQSNMPLVCNKINSRPNNENTRRNRIIKPDCVQKIKNEYNKDLIFNIK